MELYKDKIQKAIIGEFYNIDTIINEDCDLYDTTTGELIFSFKKKIIEDDFYNIDAKIINTREHFHITGDLLQEL